MAGEDNDDEEAAPKDPLDKQMQVLGGDKIPKQEIDELITGLRGKKFIIKIKLHLQKQEKLHLRTGKVTS